MIKILLLAFSLALAQPTFAATQTDLDPGALEILKAATGSVSGASAFSVRVRVARDRLATNNQILTYFNDQKVTVMRPDKMRVDIDGEHHDVQFYFDGKQATLFDPENKLYATQSATVKGIGGMLSSLEKRGVSLPMANLLREDAYEAAADGLLTAYIVGRVKMYGKTFIHLAFTEAGADWQMWIEPGDKPLPRRVEIVYKVDGSPRIAMDFLDWNLNATPTSDLFEFSKPEGAQEIQFLQEKGGK
jgi:hypothetical protein